VTSFPESGDRPAADGAPADNPPEPAAELSEREELQPEREERQPEREERQPEREERQAEREAHRRERPQGMVPGRTRRRFKAERGAMRLLATGGIIGVDVALGAVLVGQDVAGWIVGLAIGLTSVILAALLWSSRQL
jgi:hypothetical protein